MAWIERYVVSGGAGLVDGTSEANAWDWATMLTDMVAGERANIKGNITVSTASTWTNNGTATSPMSLRGYVSTIGDLDGTRTSSSGALSGSFPQVSTSVASSSTGFTLPDYCVTENVHFKATANTTYVVELGLYGSFFDCVVEGSSSGAVLFASSQRTMIKNCDFLIGGLTSAQVSLVNTGIGYCRFTNPLNNTNTSTFCLALSNDMTSIRCQFLDMPNCIDIGNATWGYISENSARNCTTFISRGTDSTGHSSITGNVVWGDNGASSKFYDTDGSTMPSSIIRNAYGNFNTAISNLGDWPDSGNVSLTSDPFISSSDLSLNSTAGGGAACKTVGTFGNDLGAIQAAASGGGGFVQGAFSRFGVVES